MTNNTNKPLLAGQRRNPNDEFFTFKETVDSEIAHYPKQFEGKHVFCSTDAFDSGFAQAFSKGFGLLGLAKLSVGGRQGTFGIQTRDGGGFGFKIDTGWDFRNGKALEVLSECDIVATNPPFSLFQAFFDLVVDHGKDFLLLCPEKALFYTRIFPHIASGRVRLGVNIKDRKRFIAPGNEKAKMINGQPVVEFGTGQVAWITTLKHTHKNPPLPMGETYNPETHPKYDNMDAIEVGRLSLLPKDYDGKMGVPITYLAKHCGTQFEILGMDIDFLTSGSRAKINGKRKFARIVIRRKK